MRRREWPCGLTCCPIFALADAGGGQAPVCNLVFWAEAPADTACRWTVARSRHISGGNLCKPLRLIMPVNFP